MIEVIGEPGSPEHEAALLVRDALMRTWPGIEATPASEDHIKIASSIKLSGQKVSDVDVVIVGMIVGRRYVIPKAAVKDADGNSLLGAKVRVKSFVAAIEVKDHAATAMQIVAGGVSVKYKDGWKSATDQNDAQLYSLRQYLRETTGTNPWVYRSVILRGINELPRHRGIQHPQAGAVPATFDASALLMAMATVGELRKHGDEYVISSGDHETMQSILASSLLTPLIPSNLDRRRMDRIAARPTEAREIAELLGNERVHIRGNGGTGKTILMLQAAYEAFQSRGTRSLVLTYNTALAADIQRTLALMGIPGDGEAGGIRVRTVMSFMHSWLLRLGLARAGEVNFGEYEGKCSEALRYFDEGALQPDEVARAIASDPLDLAFDAILVDEAQDWPQAEADLLARLYGPARIALVDGVSQLVRGAATNWQAQVAAASSQVRTKSLREGLRMKANLCRFLNTVAEEAGFQWHVTPNKQAPGGRVIVAPGDYARLDDLQQKILRQAIEAGNMPVDLLHCIPPAATSIEGGVRRSELAQAFEAKLWEAWDGVDDATRRTFPRSTASLRIVQYESCRGLEGWAAILDGLDEFWALKRGTALADLEAQGSVIDPEANADTVAWRWCMIPLTRPIDTLVITLRNEGSDLARVIRLVSSRMRDVVEFVG
ncbi:DNA/RNA helicase domain-containing protein [Mesorhizobium marinum]|uniref:DNA/RNA helicase domain-containing protein n=1 Tax=Mesorhizobium marinum TaxID=3228790 RepID=UPI0034678575